ncbi:hypothetical protein OESDEN_10625 [Oesophagostomum dentatum]|uniref:Uncharacterized protein n=1 Tax=Oesophagostomum dentatum TaxID=61180 RepID=A0A0B1SW67_OESDE|nr:hypothetical protein OESDEN_10625 [Oesophagostomum dentatum]
MSTGNLSTVEEDDEIEFCGPENEPDDYSDIYNPPETSVKLNDVPNFVYEKPDYTNYDRSVRHYTLEEMEKLFDSYADIIIV